MLFAYISLKCVVFNQYSTQGLKRSLEFFFSNVKFILRKLCVKVCILYSY